MLQVQIRRSKRSQTIKCYGNPNKTPHLIEFIKNLNTENEIFKQEMKYLKQERDLIATEIARLEYERLYLSGAPLIKRITKTNERDAITQTSRAIKDNSKKYRAFQTEINKIWKKMYEFDALKHLYKIINTLHELGFETKDMLMQENFNDKDKYVTINYVFHGNEQALIKNVFYRNKVLEYKINTEVNKFLQEQTAEDGTTI